MTKELTKSKLTDEQITEFNRVQEVQRLERIRIYNENQKRYLTGLYQIRKNGKLGFDNMMIYSDPKVLSLACIEYFETFLIDGINNNKPMSIAGMSLFVGITIQTMLEYGKSDLFSEVVKVAKGRIELYNVDNLYSKETVQGAKFALEAMHKWNYRKGQTKVTNNVFLLANLLNPSTSIDDAIKIRETDLEDTIDA